MQALLKVLNGIVVVRDRFRFSVYMHMCMYVNREPLPGELDSNLDSFQKLLVLRCLRADRLTHGLQDFVASQLGQSFIEPQVPTHILHLHQTHIII